MSHLWSVARGFMASVVGASAFLLVAALFPVIPQRVFGPGAYWILGGAAAGLVMILFTWGRADAAKFRAGWGLLALAWASLALALSHTDPQYFLASFMMMAGYILLTVGLMGAMGLCVVIAIAHMRGQRVASRSARELMPQALRDELARKAAGK